MITEVVARLEEAAFTAGLGWQAEWRRPDGQPTNYHPANYLNEIATGSFNGMAMTPGASTIVEAPLAVPALIAGVPVHGEPLEMALYSVYPIDVQVDGRSVFADALPPVAAGPALFTVVGTLAAANGTLRLDIRVPTQQRAAGWLHFRLLTPGLRHRQEQLELLAAQLILAEALAAGDTKPVDAAAALVPDDVLALTPAELDALVDDVQDRLAPLAARIADIDVHLIGHSHIDLMWLWTWEDTRAVILRDARSVLALMDEFPDMTFTHSQPASYAVIRDEAPELFERVREHIAAGRWEPATMQWVEADSNMPSGEAAVRQLVEGVCFSEDELGYEPTVFLAPDTFGHAGNMPQLARDAGARVYYHHRANPGGAWPAYWWEGQDGSRLLAVSTPLYSGEMSLVTLARDLVAGALADGHGVALHFYGIGDHGGGPTRVALERIRRLQHLAAFPRLRFSTLRAYADAVVGSGAFLPTHRGETERVWEGCYTTHADAKRLNRHAENALVTAQSLAAVAHLDRGTALRAAWRDVLFHQFHDILDGSCTHEVYAQTATDCEAAIATAQSVTEDALRVLHRGITGDVAVTNPLGVRRTDVVVAPISGSGPVCVVDEFGTAHPAQWTDGGLCFVATVDGFASAAFTVRHDDVAAPIAMRTWQQRGPSTYRAITTDLYDAVLLDGAGIITSLVDRRTGRDLVGYGMPHPRVYQDSARPDLALNVLTYFEQLPYGMSAWHLDEVHLEQYLLRDATTTVAEAGPVRVVLDVSRAFRASTITQRIAFYRTLPRVDIDCDIDWHEVATPQTTIPGLKVAFTARLAHAEPWFETPYAAVTRPSDGQEAPALRWAAVGGPEGGVAVLNDCKYGHDALGGRLRVTLVRNPFDPDAEPDTGHHHVRLALLPYVGDWRAAGVVDAAAGFNQPLLARTPSDGTRAALDAPRVGAGSVRVGTLDRARSGTGTIVRLYEAHGVPGTVTVSGLRGRVSEVTVTERPVRALDSAGGTVSLAFRPWQVRTLLVED